MGLQIEVIVFGGNRRILLHLRNLHPLEAGVIERLSISFVILLLLSFLFCQLSLFKYLQPLLHKVDTDYFPVLKELFDEPEQ